MPGYIITNGDTYIYKDRRNRAKITYFKSEAQVFNAENKAWNYIDSLPRSLKTGKYLVQKIDDESGKVSAPSPALSTAEKISDPCKTCGNTDSVQLFELKANVRIMQQVYKTAQELWTEKNIQQNKAEAKLLDLEHAVEIMPNMNARNGYQMYAMMRDARRERRECKDTKAILEAVMNSTLSDWQEGKVGLLLDSMEHRTYIPRESPELFSQGK